ncbi:hypothetical protein [Pseudomonas sp. UMAB-40]|uniref:hypothetical protein n=1 Tax=Pseudomonas sp. UMAB-40 TaxID=1365407 RepID=UPI001C598CB9|nr:hypothetical protein [Pseudomonas sp. UMAB-40]
MKRASLFFGAFSITFSAIAAVPPPSGAFDAIEWPASLRKAPSRSATFGELVIQFEKTTLAQVMSEASVGTIAHQGDAGDSVYWLCYSQPNAGALIWIISNGEMGGDNHAVTGVIAEQFKSARASIDCPALPVKLQPLSLAHDVWLGSTDVAIQQMLGMPSHQAGAWRAFDFQGRKQGECEGGYDVYNWLRTRSDKGRVNRIDAGQVTSC